MIRFECDLCGASIRGNDPQRYILKMELFAAAGLIEIDPEAPKNVPGELQAVLEQLRKADPDEVEDQTYRAFRFDLCSKCQKTVLADPLARGTRDAE
jgi:hypothetical protein